MTSCLICGAPIIHVSEGDFKADDVTISKVKIGICQFNHKSVFTASEPVISEANHNVFKDQQENQQ